MYFLTIYYLWQYWQGIIPSDSDKVRHSSHRNDVKCVECDVKPYYTHTHYSIRSVMTLTSELENLISNDFMLLATTGYIYVWNWKPHYVYHQPVICT